MHPALIPDLMRIADIEGSNLNDIILLYPPLSLIPVKCSITVKVNIIHVIRSISTLVR